MLKIKTETGDVYLSPSAIQAVIIPTDERKATIMTNEKNFTTEDVQKVKDYLYDMTQTNKEISHLSSAIRNLTNILRARLH